jgi:energy-coupling factor transporter ATP-binding protein EcfA2
VRIFSQAEKEKYLVSLSEDDFREIVVRRLFRRLGFADGRDLCGPEEQGKDAIFLEQDKFGGKSLICVQTKKGSVNLASDATKNLHDIRAQIRTALESPFKCVATKTVLFPSKVYLVASGRINESARDWITTNIGEDPRIQYLDRDDLIKSIDEHCPETWSSITADVFPYLHALSKLIEDQSVVGPTSSSVAGLKSYYAASDAAFVDLRLIKSVSSMKRQSGRITETFEFEEDSLPALLSLRGERLLLLGDAGTGKSTLLVRCAYLMAKEAAGGKNDYRVPVLLRAADLAGGLDVPLAEKMANAINQLVGSPTTAFSVEDLQLGRVTLLVDGLDEVALGAFRATVVAQLNGFFAEYPKCSVVLTTRPYTSIEEIEGVRGFTRCRILPMSLSAAEKMLTNYQRGGADEKHTKEVLRRLDGIHGIELNPLLVAVFALTAEHDKRDIPANITELFSKFTELMLGRWDEAKGMSQQYQARVKEHLVCNFAYRLHSDRQTSFEREQFETFAIKLLTSMNHGADAGQMIDEVVDRSGLFRDAGNGLEFRHHLIQEYFAGKGIPTIDHIKKLVSDEWWRNAIVFYFGSNPDDVQSLLDVATSVSADSGEASLTIGLALQTCYLSKLEDKIDVWKWVVERLAGITDKVLHEKDDQKFPIFHFLTHYILARDAVALSGIEKPETKALDWAMYGNHFATDPELRRFWGFVALSEIGRSDILLEKIKESPLSSDHLNLAITVGCSLVEAVRSIDQAQKDAAKDVRIRLKNRVSVLQHQFAKEYRGQLLEYRRGAIVALDQEEPVLSHDVGGASEIPAGPGSAVRAME